MGAWLFVGVPLNDGINCFLFGGVDGLLEDWWVNSR